MKKSMLCAGLMTVLCTTTYAEEVAGSNLVLAANAKKPQMAATGSSTQTAPNTQTSPAPSAATPTNSGTAPASTGGSPPSSNTAPPEATSPSPAATPGASKTTTPNTQTTTTPATSTTPANPSQPLDCSYRIPAETSHIDQAVVMKWAERAAEQSFNFDHQSLDKQLSTLKSCFTEQGWIGFNDALEKSGNLKAIKTQQLMVSSMINGEGKILEIKENQWKVSLPMQVVYQNDKEKLTQPLTVNLVVGRKVSGDLGIMQMIAIPRQANTAPLTGSPQPATTPTAPAAPSQSKQP